MPAVRWLGPGARGEGDLAALGITVVALVPAAAVLSAVSPAVAHLQLHDLRASGTIVGRLSAWATAGALLGTFGTGFVLVPLVPVEHRRAADRRDADPGRRRPRRSARGAVSSAGVAAWRSSPLGLGACPPPRLALR